MRLLRVAQFLWGCYWCTLLRLWAVAELPWDSVERAINVSMFMTVSVPVLLT